MPRRRRLQHIRRTPAGGAGRVGSLLSDSQNLKVQTGPAPAAGPSQKCPKSDIFPDLDKYAKQILKIAKNVLT